MPFYIFSIPLEMGSYTTLWEINGDTAVRLDVHDTGHINGGDCTAKPGQSAIDAILGVLTTKHRLGKCSHWELTRDAGQYYLRTARPFSGHNLGLASNSPGNNPGASLAVDAIAMALGQLGQYGRDIEGWKYSNASRFFNFQARPKWTEIELYALKLRQKHANLGKENWVAVPYPFTP